MLTGDVRPTTLDGVKRLAAQLRKEQGIKHSIALDLAAKAANCTNFRNAQRTLPARRTSVSRPYVLLTVYWCDEERQFKRGRETLKIELTRPILDICGKYALKNVRGFRNLRMAAADHFVCDVVARTQAYARAILCTAERSLRFMEHTGLQPFNHRKVHPNGLAYDNLPNKDHSTQWTDPASGQLVLIDEPYGGAPDEVGRAAWATQTGWQITKTAWPGMYRPYECDLYVVGDSQSEDDLTALVRKIDAMPAPLLESDWQGESSQSWATFVSPMSKTPQDARRARSRGTIYPVASATTLPYSYGFGSSMRRPAGKMEIQGHIEAGRIIKAILGSRSRPYGVYRRLNSVRSTLEDWMSLEITKGQLEGPEFFDVYYREADGDQPCQETAKSHAGVVAMLGDLKQKLRAAYPDCMPLRQQLHRIDTSVSLIAKLKPTDS